MCSECADDNRGTARRERYAADAARTLVVLGPERVARGRAALDDDEKRGWGNCFLALAYGAPGALAAACDAQVRRGDMCLVGSVTAVALAGKVLGVSATGAVAVVELFDNQVLHGRARLRSLVDEYLELNRMPAAPLQGAGV